MPPPTQGKGVLPHTGRIDNEWDIGPAIRKMNAGQQNFKLRLQTALRIIGPTRW